MSEAVRFLRFVIPGLVFTGTLLQAFLFASFDSTITCINGLGIDTGEAIVSVFLMGGLGYIFSITYRTIFPYHCINHVSTIKAMMKHEGKDLGITKAGKELTQDDINRKTSIDAANTYWHLIAEKIDMEKDGRMSDFVHAFGASFFAVLGSIPLFFYLRCHLDCLLELPIWSGIAVPVVAMFLFGFNWYRAKRMYQDWLNSTLETIWKNTRTASTDKDKPEITQICLP